MGEELTADPGTWSGNPTSFGYQWRRCDTGSPLSCADIAGATDSAYTAVADDVGHKLEVRVTATNAGGDSDPADSAPTDAVLPAPPVNESPPTISGFPQEGEILTADPGQWSNAPTDYAYQWFSCDPVTFDCPDIAGATDQDYVIEIADVGRYIGVEVIATNTGGDSDPADSDLTDLVLPAAPVNLTSPRISGTAQAGQVLSVSKGTWSGSPTGYSYQWYTCDNALNFCNFIPAATGASYRISPADIGRRLIATVVATNAGGDSFEEPSNPTDSVVAAPPPRPPPPALPTIQLAPTISGNARQGQTLMAAPGTWSNSPTAYEYQWERCTSAGTACANIAGASAGAYRLTAADVGRRLVVAVVAVNAGGHSAPAVSTPTSIVAGPTCHVPRVVGLTLTRAKARIRARHCTVGRITRRASSRAKKGRVLWQRPKAGRTLPNHGKVNLGVGKGRR